MLFLAFVYLTAELAKLWNVTSDSVLNSINTKKRLHCYFFFLIQSNSHHLFVKLHVNRTLKNNVFVHKCMRNLILRLYDNWSEDGSNRIDKAGKKFNVWDVIENIRSLKKTRYFSHHHQQQRKHRALKQLASLCKQMS